MLLSVHLWPIIYSIFSGYHSASIVLPQDTSTECFTSRYLYVRSVYFTLPINLSYQCFSATGATTSHQQWEQGSVQGLIFLVWGLVKTTSQDLCLCLIRSALASAASSFFSWGHFRSLFIYFFYNSLYIKKSKHSNSNIYRCNTVENTIFKDVECSNIWREETL